MDNKGLRHKKKPSKEVITKEGLMAKNVGEIRQKVRDLNLHYAIKNYSKLRKAELIDKFLFHYKRLKKKLGKAPALPRAKLTGLDKALGLGKPLFSKEEGGLDGGALKQFEDAYPEERKKREQREKADADFLKNLGKKKAEDTGKGKRTKKMTTKAKESLEQQPAKRAKKTLGRGQRTRKPNPKFI